MDVKGFVRHLIRKGFSGVFNLETSGSYDEQKRAILTLAEYVRSATVFKQDCSHAAPANGV